jgi:hypothetical protein
MTPGHYTIIMAKLRWREFYRMAGIIGVIQGAILKVVARNQNSGASMELPDLVEKNIAPLEELDPVVRDKLQAMESRAGITQPLFHVANKTSTDSQNENKGGGGYALIGPGIVVFYAYIWSRNRLVPTVVNERETWTCFSRCGERIFSTSNFDIGFDPAPGVEAERLKGADYDAVLRRHRDRIDDQKVVTRFSAGDRAAIIAFINHSSALSAEDKIRRGLYRRLES